MTRGGAPAAVIFGIRNETDAMTAGISSDATIALIHTQRVAARLRRNARSALSAAMLSTRETIAT